DPLYLILALVALLVFYLGKSQGARIRYSSVDRLKRLKATSRIPPRRLLLLGRCVALILFAFALARPQAGKKVSEVSSEGVDIMLALDTSGSMQGLDFKIDGRPTSRLDVVKKTAADFIRHRPGDRIGLVIFAEEAFTQCPLTLDHGILIDFLNRIETGM